MRNWLIIVMVGLITAAAQGAAPEEMLAEAQRLEKAGSDQQAAAAYQAFVEQYPEHSQKTEAMYRQAKCLNNLGLVDQAVEKLKGVTKADGRTFRNRADAMYRLGKLQADLKDYTGAATTYDKLLAEGAGLNEDEVLNLCGGYYAILGKFDDAAAKFNILKRRTGSGLAEQAAYKLVLLWLKAEKIDNAVVAIQELSDGFPRSEHIPEVLLKAADAYRKQDRLDKTGTLCAQIRNNYPKSPEAMAARYLLGLCNRQKKDFKGAVKAFEEVARSVTAVTRMVGADALLQAADVYATDLNDLPTAMKRYEDAATMARETEGERRGAILEQCYFRLGEYQFSQKKYGPALDYYLQLRNLGSKVNVLGRILACQAELKKTDADEAITTVDAEAMRKMIEANPGTQVAAEAEVFLLDRKLGEAMRGRGNVAALASEYAKIAGSYPAEVLGKEGLDAYVMSQAGICWGNGTTKEEGAKSVAAFEKSIALGKENVSHTLGCLENIALVSERFGDMARARKAYAELFAITKSDAEARPEDKQLAQRATGYLQALLTRADTKDAIEQSIETAKKIIEDKGALSDMGRAARFYVAELYYLKKDYSTAARAWQEFIVIHGPKQDAGGDVVGAPWQPAAMNESVEQLYDAAVRIAHCWYLQGHEQNTVRAYAWMVKNFPVNNRFVPEAQYWLCLELGKGQQGQTKEAKRKMGEAMWRNVVNPSMDFEQKKFTKTFHPWVGSEEDRYAEAQGYVKSAMLKAGQAFSEAGDHETAAEVFGQYLEIYIKQSKGRRSAGADQDEKDSIARYALGREYIALKSPSRLVEVYKAYLGGLRQDRFRVSGLKLLGFHAGKAEMWEIALEAYATLLDEYGVNRVNASGQAIPVAHSERLRSNSRNWDGIRMAAPKDLNFGEIRYALGYLYWKHEDYARCAIALRAFAEDAELRGNNFRDRALYMAAQSFFKLHDGPAAAPSLLTLLKDHPNFEAIEEAHVYAAQALVEAKNFDELELVYRNFIRNWSKSERRQRMELYYAAGLAAQGKLAGAMPILKSLAEGETFEDVKADAWYQLGLIALRDGERGLEEAARRFEKSVSVYAREGSCLEAAKAFYKLRQAEKAGEYLDRISRDFGKGDRRVIDEAKSLAATIEREKRKRK